MILVIALLAVAQGVRTLDDANPRDKFVDTCQDATCVSWDDPARGYWVLVKELNLSYHNRDL